MDKINYLFYRTGTEAPKTEINEVAVSVDDNTFALVDSLIKLSDNIERLWRRT